jgi:subtilisin family serine protease
MWLKRVALVCLFVLGISFGFATHAIGQSLNAKSFLHNPSIVATKPPRIKIPKSPSPRITLPNPVPNPSVHILSQPTPPPASGNNSNPSGNPSNTFAPPTPSPSPAESPAQPEKPKSELSRTPDDSDECQSSSIVLRTEQTPNDSLYCLQWNFRKYPGINVEEAWEKTHGKGVTNAVIDTGIDFEDTDFEPTRFKQGLDYVPSSIPVEIKELSESKDFDGHGTHIAGTIAQTTGNSRLTAGIAYESDLIAVRVNLKPDTVDDKSDEHIVEQIQQVAYAIKQTTDRGADVINLSIQAPNECNPSIQAAAAYAYSKGVVLVAAAGNLVGTKTYPIFRDTYYNPPDPSGSGASCGGMIAHGLIVAASNRSNDNRSPVLASYSNDNDANILAPGGEFEDSISPQEGCITKPAVLSKIPKNVRRGITQSAEGGRVRICQGTSQAAAHVSGSASLVASILKEGGISRNSHIFPDLVVSILEETAHIAEYDVRNGKPYTHEEHNPAARHPLDAGKAVKLASFVTQKFGSRPIAHLTTEQIEKEVAKVVKDNLKSLSPYTRLYPQKEPPPSPPKPFNFFDLLVTLSVAVIFLALVVFLSYHFWQIRFISGMAIGAVGSGLVLTVGAMVTFLSPLPMLIALIVLSVSPAFLIAPCLDKNSKYSMLKGGLKRNSLLIGATFGSSAALLWLVFSALSIGLDPSALLPFIGLGITTIVMYFFTWGCLSEAGEWFEFASICGMAASFASCSLISLRGLVLGVMDGVLFGIGPLLNLAAVLLFGVSALILAFMAAKTLFTIFKRVFC